MIDGHELLSLPQVEAEDKPVTHTGHHRATRPPLADHSLASGEDQPDIIMGNDLHLIRIRYTFIIILFDKINIYF